MFSTGASPRVVRTTTLHSAWRHSTVAGTIVVGSARGRLVHAVSSGSTTRRFPTPLVASIAGFSWQMSKTGEPRMLVGGSLRLIRNRNLGWRSPSVVSSSRSTSAPRRPTTFSGWSLWRNLIRRLLPKSSRRRTQRRTTRCNELSKHWRLRKRSTTVVPTRRLSCSWPARMHRLP